MKNIGDHIKGFIREIRETPEDGDYFNDDGLLICGKCGTPREYMADNWRIEMLKGKEPRYTIMPQLCDCRRAEAEAKEERERRIAESRRIERNRAACFDFNDMAGCVFDNDDRANPEASDLCRDYVKHFADVREAGQGIIMAGTTGTGKTFLAACIANALLEKGYRVRFTSLTRLNSKVTANYGNGYPIIEELLTYDLVVLDDLGTERKTPVANENAYQVIDTLSEKGIPMIFTTNLSLAEMSNDSTLDNARIYSRLFPRCRTLKFEGHDRRRKTDNIEWKFGN